MPFIWNDKTFDERCKKGNKILLFIFLPLWLLNLIFWFFIYDNLLLEGIILLSFFSSTTLYSFFDIFYQTPHPKIPDNYSIVAKTLLYVVIFLLSLGIFSWMLNHYKII